MKRLFAAVAAGAVTGAVVFGALAVAQGGDPGTLSAVLTGKKEVDAEGNKGVGDDDGRGGFTGVLDGRRLCYGIAVKDIGKPAQAHIHRGGKNVAGPVVQPLEVPSSGNPGAVGACVRLSKGLRDDIASNPGGFYVNVHNAAFAGGAVRGQITARK
jgi:CHRD domain